MKPMLAATTLHVLVLLKLVQYIFGVLYTVKVIE